MLCSTNKFTLNYQQKTNFASGRLSYCSCLQERKVRTPQSSIAGNTRPPFSERTSATESKYSSAVVKSGKLYAVQRQVVLQLRVARPM